MKNPQQMIAIAICSILVIAIVGSIASGIVVRNGIQADSSSTGETAAPIPAVELYEQAAKNISSAQDLTLSISESTTTTTDNGIFSERTERSVQYSGLGTKNISAHMDETLSIGDYKISWSEYFFDGMRYLTLGGGKFCGEITREEYLKRNIPPILFDPSLYNNIAGHQADDDTVIKFEAPSEAENWALPEGATFNSAAGFATLNNSMQLTASTYDISYSIDSIQITKRIEISIQTDPVTLNLPSIDEFTRIEHPNTPILLEKACGYLMQAQSVTANIQDSIICDAFGDNRTQTVAIDMHGEGSKFMAKLDLSALLVNSSRGGEELRKSENILFRDGNYSVAIDGVPSQNNAQITAKDMRINCQDLLLSTILLPKYITGVSLTDLGDAYRFDFTTAASLSETLCKNACDILYKDPEFLINLSDDSNIENLGAYLQISKTTGLPTASGIFYTGTYTIDGHSYMLKYHTDQTYDITSDTAYNTITE